MIELHAHILPELDDGAADLATAAEMARAAAAAGITRLVATSHYSRGAAAGYDRAFAALAPIARGEGVILEPGMEYDYDRIGGLREEELRHLGSSNYLLIDLKQHWIPSGVEPLFFRLKLQGAQIVIAHPERLFYRDIAASTRKLAAMDVSFQINSGSILGRYGRSVRRAAYYLMDYGFCHLIADDAHHVAGFRLNECRECLLRRYSADVIAGWLDINPSRLLESRNLLTFRPPKNRRERFREWLCSRLGR